jgi:hypothetical protein
MVLEEIIEQLITNAIRSEDIFEGERTIRKGASHPAIPPP